jgi:HAD superfamily hydrolase (TIGR01662 family)
LEGSTRLRVRAVVFDVGETLFDETREYGTWADWLGVPRHTFSAVFGAVIAIGRDYREVFQVFRPGFRLDEERQRRVDRGCAETFDLGDLYPDAVPAITDLKRLGYQVGVAGNQTARAHHILLGLGLPVDWIATSSGWGVEKPDTAFFERVAAACAAQPPEVVYVGDRLDNDIVPARAAGLRTVMVRRGPWGTWAMDHGGAEAADARIDSLLELPRVLVQIGGG